MDAFEKIKEKVEQNAGTVEFRDFGDGTTDDWIEKAELALGVKFPVSYKWWLKNYGGGEILGEEIFSIYEMDFEEVVGGDVVKMTKLYRSRGFDKDSIVISVTDRGEVFYLKTSEMNDFNDCPVALNITGATYAKNFIDFLQKRIDENIT